MRGLDAHAWVPIAAICAPLAAHATQYLTVDQAQRLLFPQAERFVAAPLRLTPEMRDRIATASGVASRRDEQPVWRALRGDDLLGFVFVDEVIGKHELITYAVAIGSDGVVRGVEILDYREPRGGEVRDARWRAQFIGRRSRDPVRVDQDIQNLSGATLSSRHIADGVRRILALHRLALAQQ